MSEQRLQSDIVRKFSELYPYKKGQLFHVANERNSSKQAFIAQSIGIVPGVSDLIYFECNFTLDLSMKGIELKTPNSRHKVEHIKVQLNWGKTLEKNGGHWRLCRSVKEAIYFIDSMGYDEGLTIEDVEKMIQENGNKKTIKF